MSTIQSNLTIEEVQAERARYLKGLSAERFWKEFAAITDESDAMVDWEEAERDLDSFRPDRKLFAEAKGDDLDHRS